MASDDDLEAARRAFPDWDIRAVGGSYVAVPAGTPFVTRMFLDSLTDELRAEGK